MSILGAIGGLGGSLLSGLFGSKAADKQAKLQTQFAKSGIQWKVEDAKKAGVHPLAALGAQTASYSPVSVGVPDFSRAGQEFGNAIYRTQDATTRRTIDLGLEKAGLENELLRAQINSIRSTRGQSVPGIPTRSNTAIPGQPATELGAAPQDSYLRDPMNMFHLTDPSAADAQRAEDRYGESADYIEGIRNRFLDWFYSRNGLPYQATRQLYEMRMRRGLNPLGPGGLARDRSQYRHW